MMRKAIACHDLITSTRYDYHMICEVCGIQLNIVHLLYNKFFKSFGPDIYV